ncbi:MAG: hypothetical protein WD648_12210 [Planctomycetaceae bacterium]
MIIILWTIRVALAFYFISVAALIPGGPSTRVNQLARAAWTMGLVFYVMHVASAFHFSHGWSHAAAYEHTARRTADVVGLDFGGGLYVNYAFTLVWLLDVAWWWRDAAGYRNRPRWNSYSLHAFFAFIVFNATVVFGEGPIRWVGLAAFTACAVWWMAQRPNPTS